MPWGTKTFNFWGYHGNVRFQFTLASGNSGDTTKLDNLAIARSVVPTWETPGSSSMVVQRLDGGPNGAYASVTEVDGFLSTPFTVPQCGAKLTFWRNATAGSYQVSIKYGTGYTSETQASQGTGTDTGAAWQQRTLDLSAYAGQNIRFNFALTVQTMGYDEVAVSGEECARVDEVRGAGTQAGEPVDFVTGAFAHSHTDISIPARGVPLEFTRYYSSLATGDVGLGQRWTHTYSARALEEPDGSVRVYDARGGLMVFALQGAVYVPPTGIFGALTKAGSVFTLIAPSQIRSTFDVATGRLTSIADRNNNTTNVAYDANGIHTVTAPGGRALTFTVVSGRITLITDPLPSPDTRTIGYTYDGNGDLTNVQDVKGGNTVFTYAKHQLLTIRNSLPAPVTVDTNIYDLGGRVVEQTDALGGRGCFYYGNSPLYTSAGCPGVGAVSAGTTVYVNPRGYKTTYYFDSSFRTTDIVDHLGGATAYTFEASGALCSPANNGNVCSVTDPLNHTTNFTYDAVGNVLTVRDARPTPSQYTYTYTAQNDVCSATDPLGHVTQYAYAGGACTTGNLSSVTSTVGGVAQTTTFAYADTVNNPGLVTSITDPLSHATAFTYDTNGNRLTVADPLGDTFTYTYDLGGRVTSVKDAMTPPRFTYFTYDKMNALTSVEDAYNGPTAKTLYTYDAVGNRRTVTNPRGYTTTYAYDNKNRLATVTDALLPTHRVTLYTYDANDDLQTVKDGRHQSTSRTTTYTYDALDRLTNIAYPDVHYSTAFTYFADGTRQTMTDTRGLCGLGSCDVGIPVETYSDTTTYGYDEVRNLTSVATTFKLPPPPAPQTPRTVQYGYDAANNRNKVTYPDAVARWVDYTFDEKNRMKKVTPIWTGGGFTEYFYDAAGRLDHTNLPASTGVTSSYGYDNPGNHLTSVTHTKAGAPPTTLSSFNYLVNPNGNRTQVTDTTGVTTYHYDVLDRLADVTYPASATTVYSYDGAGNRTQVQVGANPPTAYAYDETDQLKPDTVTSYKSDKNGNLTSTGPLNGAQDNFYYDLDSRLFRTGPCIGNVDANSTVNGTDVAIIAAHATSNEGETKYDLLADVDANLQINSIDLALAAAENNKSCRNAGPNTGEGRYWYNGDGLRVRNRTFYPSPSRVDDDYVWDVGAGLPVVLQDIRTPISGSATTTTNVYGLGLISATDNAGVTSYYLSDGLGSTAQIASSTGAVVDGYTYDVFGGPRGAPNGGSNDFRFTGQQNDHNANRGLYYLRARAYDPALGRFLSKDPLPLLNRYSYAGNNSVNFADPTGLCCNPTDLVKDSISLVGETGSWVLDHGACVAVGGVAGCAAVQGASSAASWTRDQLIKLCPEGSSGYLDFNLTAGIGTVGAVGVQCSREQGFHPYYGAGGGVGASLSVTYGRHQSITPGTFCGAQGTYGGGKGGGTVNVGFGGIDSLLHLKLPAGFLEFGGSRSSNAGGSLSVICGVVN